MNATDIDFDSMTDDEFADYFFAQLDGQPATLSCNDIVTVETGIASDRSTRKAALLALTLPYDELQEKVASDREYAEAIAEVNSLLSTEKYESLVTLLKQAQARMMGALCSREDMPELLKRNA